MDIFTTFLTRVVSIPIKPASLKVKALLKDAGTSKLKEDSEHLENHNYYFVKKQTDNEENQEKDPTLTIKEQKNEVTDEKETDSEPKEGVKHLDLYV